MSLWSRLLNRISQRSVYGPNTPGNPDPWMVAYWGGQPATSGTVVSETTALSWTALMCGIRFISETIATLPLRVYRRDQADPRKKERLFDHPIAQLVREPNPEQSWFEFMELSLMHAILWGNSYAQIIWSGGGEPLELWPLNPDRCSLRRDARGRLIYQVALPRDDLGSTGGMAYLSAEDVLHVRGPSRWGLLGERLVHTNREAIGLGLATEEFAARFFGQGMHAGGILTHPGQLSKQAKERLADDVDRQAGGLTRSHRTAIFEEGMKWVQTTIEPEKAQFLGVRQFQVTEAARMLRVPPHLLYDLSRATFANIEHQSIEAVVFTILPWARRYESRIDKQLISVKMQNLIYTKFELDGMLRGDSAARNASFTAGRQGGWYSQNDVREILDMNPIPGGNVYTTTPAGSPPNQPANPVGDGNQAGDQSGDQSGALTV